MARESGPENHPGPVPGSREWIRNYEKAGLNARPFLVVDSNLSTWFQRGIRIVLMIDRLNTPEEAAVRASECSFGTGAWAPEVLAEDARRLANFRENRLVMPWDEARAWLEGWGSSDAGLPPSVRRL